MGLKRFFFFIIPWLKGGPLYDRLCHLFYMVENRLATVVEMSNL